MPGGAPMFRAGDREAEDPETPPCEGGLVAASTATGSSPAEATAAIADPCGSAPRADAAPLSNASGSAPSRTGRPDDRTKCERLPRTIFWRAPPLLNGRGRVAPEGATGCGRGGCGGQVSHQPPALSSSSSASSA